MRFYHQKYNFPTNIRTLKLTFPVKFGGELIILFAVAISPSSLMRFFEVSACALLIGRLFFKINVKLFVDCIVKKRHEDHYLTTLNWVVLSVLNCSL